MSRLRNVNLDELCLLGVEDGSFRAFDRQAEPLAYLCCTRMKGRRIKWVALLPIEVDGLDATNKLLTVMSDGMTDAVILGGITFAGFNVIDPHKVFQETGVPVIVYSGKRPDDGSMLIALKTHFSDWKMRWAVIESLGKVHEVITKPGEPPVYFEVVGGSTNWAKWVLGSSALVCRIPEPVRVARIIARGVSPIIY